MVKVVLGCLLIGAVALVQSRKCPENKFWSTKLDECILCSKCEQSYRLKPCSQFNDTVCAESIKLSLDFLHPSKENTHHFKPDRLHFINEDVDEDDNYDDLDDDDDDDDDNLDDLSDEIKLKKDNKKKEKNIYLDEDEDDDDDDDFDSDEDEDFKINHNELDGSYKKKHYLFGTKDDKSLFKKQKKHYVFSDERNSHKKKKNKNHKHWKDDSDDIDDAEVYEKLEGLLIDSKNKLKHKKDDLLKHLKRTESEKKLKLNQPKQKMLRDILGDLIRHEMHAEEHGSESWMRRDDSLGQLLELESDEIDRRAAVPTHRMFLGEPSTVSEIIGQGNDARPVSDHAKKVVLEKSKLSSAPLLPDTDSDEGDADVMSVPFSPAEALVWDWQAVSLVSAVGACLLFFVVAAIYILLTSREQTNRIKITDHDAEEMTTMVALMPDIEKGEGRCPRNLIYKPTVVPKGASGHLTPYVHSNSYRHS